MIDHFGFIEANRIAKTLWTTVIGTTEYFHISLNQIKKQNEKEKIPDEIPSQKDGQKCKNDAVWSDDRERHSAKSSLK